MKYKPKCDLTCGTHKNRKYLHWPCGSDSDRRKYNSGTQRYKDPKCRKKYQRKYQRKVRLATLEILGGKCVRCGFDDYRALQIDHIRGGGSKERKERKYIGNFHKYVIQSALKKENKYQLLCANCNWIKRVENDERNMV